ncbi:MAG: nucleoside monophosphate kinase [Patescibacteria group bacterium]|nr:nucleoside monophosphate kinase [Patescibacteria group bacterium]
MKQQRPALRLIFFYGKGGAGKDTEAERIVRDNPGWAIISTGDRIKQARNPNDELHSVIAPYEYLIDQGINLPMTVIINPEVPEKSIIPSFIAGEIEKGISAIISTGFPRTHEQLDALDAYLKKLGQQGYDVTDEHFYFDVSDETSLKRILGRPAEYAALGKSVRSDDTETAARKRLEVFISDTLPVVDELRARGRILEISGEGTKDQTHSLVEEALFPKSALEISSLGAGESYPIGRLPGERR